MFLEKVLSLLYQAEIRENYVVKKYSTWRGLKWLPAKLLLPFYPYALSPSERVAREAMFLTSDLPTPKLIAVGRDFIIREYLEGEVLGPEPALVADALDFVHSRCWALGDAKYDNFLLKGNRIFYIDGEQAVRTCDPLKQSADLVVASVFLFLAKGCKAVTEFLDEYPREDVKRELKKSLYMFSFCPNAFARIAYDQ